MNHPLNYMVKNDPVKNCMIKNEPVIFFALISILFFLTGCAQGPSSTDEDRMLRAAQNMQTNGHVPTAITMYQQLHEKSSDKLSIALKLAQAHIDNNELEEAKKVYETALAYDHENKAKKGLARCYVLGGKLQTAMSLYQEILNHTPHDPEVHNAFGVTCAFMGKHKEAETAFRRALEKDANNPEFISNLALALSAMGKTDEALTLIQPIASQQNLCPKLKNNIATVYALSGKTEKARQLFIQTVGEQGTASNLNMLQKIPPQQPHFEQPAVERRNP